MLAEVGAPEATSRAARTRAIERFGASPHASSSAGERPASQAAEGGARSVPQALRRPWRRTIERWIAAARRGLDQLLADRPGERLERLRAPARPQPRPAPDHRADQRVPAEAAMESRRSWSTPSANRMRSIAAACSVPRLASARIRTAPPAAQARTTHLLLADPERSRERPIARDHDPVASRPRKPVRPGGDDILLECGGYRSLRRWMSTRNEREAATSTFFPAPPPRRSEAGARPAQDADEQEGGHAHQEAARGGRHRGRQRDLHAPLDRPRLGEHRQWPDLCLALLSGREEPA